MQALIIAKGPDAPRKLLANAATQRQEAATKAQCFEVQSHPEIFSRNASAHLKRKHVVFNRRNTTDTNFSSVVSFALW